MTYKKSCGHPFVSRLQLQQLSEVADPFVAKIFKAKGSTATGASGLSEAEKYRRAQQAFVRIGGELARFPDDQFESALEAMETWWYNLRQGHITDEEVVQTRPHTPDKSDDDTGSASGFGDSRNDPPDTTGTPNGSKNESNEKDNDEYDAESATQVAESGTQMTITDCNTASTPLLVRLSGNVRRVGRPKLNRSVMKEKARVAHKEYNQGMKLRALLRESDVCDVSASLQEILPPVREVGSYLATYQVKSRNKTIVIKWSVDMEYVPDRVRFRLAESVIDDALDQLKQGLASDEHIELNSDGEKMDNAACYVVAIEKVGRFTREQLEAMKFLWNLQAACREAVLCCSWLTRSVKAAVDDPAPAQTAAVNLLESWPYAAVNGFGFDLTYSDLFRFRDSSWLNDNALRAFTVYLAKYKNNITVMLPPTDEESGVVIGRGAKQVKVYDSMNGKKHRKSLHLLVAKILVKATKDTTYSVLELVDPIQKDSDSSAPSDVSARNFEDEAEVLDSVGACGADTDQLRSLRILRK
ncbi:hypothetical protein PInf_012426 [Phytophthora infestans]|nr:hypothetical protein PInf_012426 [Phytophthora infestans]